MNDIHSVISAMLDNEPFEPAVLNAALETAEGRELLIDLVALRRLVQVPSTAAPPTVLQRPRPAWRLLAAAAVVLAAVSGYVVGHQQGDRAGTVVTSAPQPTRVVESTGSWQPVPPGGMQ
jgi:hypothetical protein